MTKQLELSRKERLKRLEAEIAEDLQAFVNVGTALSEIKRDELWREASRNSFNEYIVKSWIPRITPQYARQLMKAAELAPVVKKETGVSFSERDIRPLEAFVSVAKDGTIDVDSPKVEMALSRASELAALGDRPISDKYIQAAVDEIKKNEKLGDLAPAPIWDGEWRIDAIYQADVTSKDWLASMPEGRVDFIITDPPWRPDAEGGTYTLYEAVGRMAMKTLKPGGFCAVYLGKLDLPLLVQIMMAYLDYEWTFAVYQPDNSHSFRKTQYKEAWRPIGIFRKPGPRTETIYQPDAITCTRDKSFHEWQQGIEPVKLLIEKYTAAGHLVLDPFAGGGTGPFAAKEAGRHFLGFDLDDKAVSATLGRLNE